MAEEKPFGKLRSLLWPIRRCELKKFVPMFLLFFLISINYHLLRITKDALIITAPSSGAEVIPFLKPFAVLPTAVLMVFLFTRFSNHFSRENIFYALIGLFLAFFLIFTFYLYPNREALFPNNFADFLQANLPSGLKGFVAMIRYWVYTTFYVMAESWSIIVLSILIWGFANDVTKVEEAKRFYALFGIGINSAGIIAGKAGEILANNLLYKTHIHPLSSYFGCQNAWDQTFLIVLAMIIIICVLSIIIYKMMHLYVFPHHKQQAIIEKSTRPKMSICSNIRYILKSKYLMTITIIVLSYNLVNNITEVLWKDQIKELYPSPGEYAAYFSKITFYVGLIATFGSFCVSGNIIRHLGWKTAAYITPAVIILTGIGFFYFLFLKESSPSLSLTFLGMTPLALTVFFGSMQNVLMRSSKYTVFDDTKEMAFIPLDSETRIQGKSAIDGIGSRLGKSGSSIIMQALILSFATTTATAPCVMGIIILIMPLWLAAIHFLGKNFEETTAKETVTQNS